MISPPRRGKLLLTLLPWGYKNFPRPPGKCQTSMHHCPAAPTWVCRSCTSPELFLLVLCWVFYAFFFFLNHSYKKKQQSVHEIQIFYQVFIKKSCLYWLETMIHFFYLHIEICPPILHLKLQTLWLHLSWCTERAPNSQVSTSRLQITFHIQTQKKNCSFLLAESFHVYDQI